MASGLQKRPRNLYVRRAQDPWGFLSVGWNCRQHFALYPCHGTLYKDPVAGLKRKTVIIIGIRPAARWEKDPYNGFRHLVTRFFQRRFLSYGRFFRLSRILKNCTGFLQKFLFPFAQHIGIDPVFIRDGL